MLFVDSERSETSRRTNVETNIPSRVASRSSVCHVESRFLRYQRICSVRRDEDVYGARDSSEFARAEMNYTKQSTFSNKTTHTAYAPDVHRRGLRPNNVL